MNKVFYLGAAAALALASCSNDEVVGVANGDAINFSTAVGLNSRGTQVTTGTLETANKLYVTTFTTAGEALYKETEYTKVGNEWTAGQFWGNNSQLNFFLTYPKLSEWKADAELTQASKTVTGFTVADQVADQKDFVATNVTGSKGNVISAELKHVLSQIELQAKSSNANYVFKVKGYRLHNVANTGDINLESNVWSNVTGSKNYEVTFDAPQTLGADAKPIMGTVAGNPMLLPQTVTKWNGTDKSTDTTTPVTGSYISIYINITTNAGAAIYPAESTTGNETYGWVSVPVDFTWTAGNKYIYTLDFSKGAGKVDPVNPGPDVKPGDKDPEKTDPVLGEEIKFNVTVKAWDEVASDVEM